MITLKQKMQNQKTTRQLTEFVWDGPCNGGPKGGITQSLISSFLMCRERFRLRNIVGLSPPDTFNHRIEYGSMWHVCEEAFATGENPVVKNQKTSSPWDHALFDYCAGLCKRYKTQQAQIERWYHICKTQFPIYVDYWEKHPDVKKRNPLLQEQTFHVPYKLPSGNTVYLRGKWDAVDVIGKEGIFLQENKTKGDIREEQMKRQLSFDLQTLFYLVALNKWLANPKENGAVGQPCKRASGVRYNVIRRPLSGGKGSIVQYKPTKQRPLGETDEQFYTRLRSVISEEPSFFFMRWKVGILPQDVERFEHDFLIPCLEQLCDWYAWIDSPKGRKDPFADSIHYRTPYGLYNTLAEGGSTDVDEFLATGSELGLTRGNSIFKELQ